MTTHVGRNDPCPCGSGRKYKHCCLAGLEAADAALRQLRAAEERTIGEILERATEEYDAALLVAALEEFFIWGGVPEQFEEMDEFVSFFLPWFVFDYVADSSDPDTPADAPDEPLAAQFLRRHATVLPPVERAFLEAALATGPSYYVVTRTNPGHDIMLRDVLTQSEIIVREESASRSVRPGGLIFTRLVTVDNVSIMTGAAPLFIPPQWHGAVLDMRKRMSRAHGTPLTSSDLRGFNLELRELYFEIEEATYNPPLPELQNTDGDPIVLTRMRFALGCDASSALERLKSLAIGGPPSIEFDETGAIRRVSLAWVKKGKWPDPRPTILGHLTIADGRLEVDVNSRRRARKIRREIEVRLGGDAVLEETTTTTADELLEGAALASADDAAVSDTSALENDVETEEILREAAAAHWKAWFDEKIPALANKSPRQAARTPEGRERLEALLAYYEWESDRAPHAFRPDVAALRAKLNLPRS